MYSVLAAEIFMPPVVCVAVDFHASGLIPLADCVLVKLHASGHLSSNGSHDYSLMPLVVSAVVDFHASGLIPSADYE
jgi:hypothetical protein